MASYYATKLEKGFITGKPCGSCGTFNNIVIDGRLSLSSAIEVARNHLKKENNYNGFAIEKLYRAWDYKNPPDY